MSSRGLTLLVVSLIGLNISFLSAQCKLLSAAQLRNLAKASFIKKIEKLYDKNAKVISVNGDRDDCEYRTFALCKNYLSDTQWHWAEIVTFNSCDRILSYSTSFKEEYDDMLQKLMRRYKKVGERSYNGLDFEVYQNQRGHVVEINAHPNPQGMMFYLVNILRS